MIGADIVDLTDPLLKPRSSRELRFISHPKDDCPFTSNESLLFWAFWSAKEAIFKAHRCKEPFTPKQIAVSYEAKEGNRWRFSGKWIQQVSGYTIVSEKKIISVATSGNLSDAVYHQYQLKTQHHSVEIRQYFQTNLPPNAKLAEDEMGLPIVIHEDKQIPISISHHHHRGLVALMPFNA